jgi:hypothetical protein
MLEEQVHNVFVTKPNSTRMDIVAAEGKVISALINCIKMDSSLMFPGAAIDIFVIKLVRLVMKRMRIFKSNSDTCPFMSTSKMDDPEGGMHLSEEALPEQIMFNPHPFQKVLFKSVPHRGHDLGVKYFTRARASAPEISQSAFMLPVTLRVLHELIDDELRIQRGICLKKAIFEVMLLAGQTMRAGIDERNLVLLSSGETID